MRIGLSRKKNFLRSYRITPVMRPWPCFQYNAIPGRITNIRPWPYKVQPITTTFKFIKYQSVPL